MNKRINNPLVSVVIATYNRANLLHRCLTSLKSQTLRNFEVLICDDGSTDNSKEIINEFLPFLDITYDYKENFGGPANPRNRGIQLSRAPYIAFLDSDDWWMSKKLEVSLDYLNKGADIVYHDLLLVKKDKQRFFFRKVPTRDLKTPVFKDLLIRGNGLTNSSVVLKKDLLYKIGGISEEKDLIAAEDYDTWLRISKLTEKFKKIHQPLGYYWLGTDNITNPKRTLRNIHAIENRYLEDIAKLNQGNSPSWISYARVRSDYCLGNYKDAKKGIVKLFSYKNPITIAIKCLWMRLAILIKKTT